MQILREYGKRIEFSSEGRVNEGVLVFLSHKLTSKIGNLANSSDTTKYNLDFN